MPGRSAPELGGALGVARVAQQRLQGVSHWSTNIGLAPRCDALVTGTELTASRPRKYHSPMMFCACGLNPMLHTGNLTGRAGAS